MIKKIALTTFAIFVLFLGNFLYRLFSQEIDIDEPREASSSTVLKSIQKDTLSLPKAKPSSTRPKLNKNNYIPKTKFEKIVYESIRKHLPPRHQELIYDLIHGDFNSTRDKIINNEVCRLTPIDLLRFSFNGGYKKMDLPKSITEGIESTINASIHHPWYDNKKARDWLFRALHQAGLMVNIKLNKPKKVYLSSALETIEMLVKKRPKNLAGYMYRADIQLKNNDQPERIVSGLVEGAKNSTYYNRYYSQYSNQMANSLKDYPAAGLLELSLNLNLAREPAPHPYEKYSEIMIPNNSEDLLKIYQLLSKVYLDRDERPEGFPWDFSLQLEVGRNFRKYFPNDAPPLIMPNEVYLQDLTPDQEDEFGVNDIESFNKIIEEECPENLAWFNVNN